MLDLPLPSPDRRSHARSQSLVASLMALGHRVAWASGTVARHPAEPKWLLPGSEHVALRLITRFGRQPHTQTRTSSEAS
eukprot:4589248-Alexandrium_andersonii.AAC.1